MIGNNGHGRHDMYNRKELKNTGRGIMAFFLEKNWASDTLGQDSGLDKAAPPVNPTCTFLLEVVTCGLTASKLKGFE